MKKTFRFMAVLATVAATIASCAKAEMDAPANEDAAGENVYQGPTKILTFEAQTGTPQTRTSLGNVVTDGDGKKTQPVLWEADDEIKILYVVDGTEYSVNVTPKSVNGSTAVFEAKVPETGVDTYYAVYPSMVNSTITMGENETGELKVTIESGNSSRGEVSEEVSKGLFKNANIMVAKCAASSPVLNFKHACSIIKFTTGDTAPGNVYLYSGDRKFNRGHSYVNFDDSNSISEITTASQKDKYSYVNANKANTDYYIAHWPDHTLQDGFIIAFRSGFFINTKDGWRVAYYPQDITLGRGEILDLGVIQNKIRTDYFVAKEAKGKKDGSSWDNACDIAYVRNMFAEPADEDYAYAQQMKLENTNFWFAGDATFVFGTNATPRLDMCFAAASKSNRCPINFYGGCTGKTGTDKARDPENHPTVFSGNSTYAIFSVRNKTTLTLDGITLSDARAVAANKYDGLYGAALYVGFISSAVEGSIYQYGLTFADYAPQVHVNNCIFKGNIEGDANLNGGMAIYLQGGKVYADNTDIIDNQNYNRGSVRVDDNALEGSVLFMNACKFSNNESYARGYALAIWAKSINCVVGLNNCNFHSNGLVKANGQSTTSSGIISISSPAVILNNSIVESSALHRYGVGLLRFASANETDEVFANNIIIDTNPDPKSDVYCSVYVDDPTIANVQDKGNNIVRNTYNAKDKKTMDLAETSLSGQTAEDMNLSLDNALGYYTWSGNVDGFIYAKSEDMIAATTANSKIGDDFYNWLVEIGAIVEGQFTDCRGYLRAKDKMCPGAYDPFATAAE